MTRRWIEHWDPEDDEFWETTGKRVARRNLWFSVFSEHIGFSIWTLWSVVVLFMGPAYGFSAADKFLLVSTPTVVGAIMRIPYTFAVARFGGRNWTVISAVLLLIPTVLTAIVLHPGTSLGTFVLMAALGGVGGGNFASSMANINTFYPERYKGWALGLNSRRRKPRRRGDSARRTPRHRHRWCDRAAIGPVHLPSPDRHRRDVRRVVHGQLGQCSR